MFGVLGKEWDRMFKYALSRNLPKVPYTPVVSLLCM
jgi:hypothetical protein